MPERKPSWSRAEPMNSIWRIGLTNLLPSRLSKQHPFSCKPCIACRLPSSSCIRGSSRYSSEQNYPMGASGFWFRGLHPFIVRHPRISNLNRSAVPCFIPRSIFPFQILFFSFITSILPAPLYSSRERWICDSKCSNGSSVCVCVCVCFSFTRAI